MDYKILSPPKNAAQTIKKSKPDFSFEDQHQGHVCGLDEVGRAPLAGPVVAACVFIPQESRNNKCQKEIWDFVNDSKALSKKKREELSVKIKEHAMYSIKEIHPRKIEDINILQASFLAMKEAYQELCMKEDLSFDMALIDGSQSPDFPYSVQTIIKGDSKSVSIAASSIIAKVHRDNLMAELSKQYPHYGWDRNVGYPTKEHLQAIEEHGITDLHRRSFAPIKNYLKFGSIKEQRNLPL